MSFIRILEPWGGGHHEFDTGYGNRVQHWETLHKLQNIQASDHSVQVEANYWQELKYVNFPREGKVIAQNGSGKISAISNGV